MAHANNFLAKGYGEDRQWLAPFNLLDDTSTSKFSIDASGNVIAAGTVTSAGQVDSGGNASFTTLTVSGDTQLQSTVEITGILTCSAKIDLSGIAASAAELKIAATSDTPTVAFTDNGGASHAPTTAPAGYLKVTVGSSSRYIPFWA